MTFIQIINQQSWYYVYKQGWCDKSNSCGLAHTVLETIIHLADIEMATCISKPVQTFIILANFFFWTLFFCVPKSYSTQISIKGRNSALTAENETV